MVRREPQSKRRPNPKADPNPKSKSNPQAKARPRPAAPEHLCTPAARFVAPSVVAGAILLGVFVIFLAIHMIVVKDRIRIFLQLTTWTHVLVGAYLLVMRTLDEQQAAVMGIAVLGIALAVMMGRFASIHVPAKSCGDALQDLFTHAIVPATILFFVLAGHVPRIDKVDRAQSIKKACGYALFFLGGWLVTNLVAQHSREGRWVYRHAMNPRTLQGRKELSTTAIVAIACVIMAAVIEYVRPQRAIDVSPSWPT
jgi:hypothetical protein